jgi:hypothetical protein
VCVRACLQSQPQEECLQEITQIWKSLCEMITSPGRNVSEWGSFCDRMDTFFCSLVLALLHEHSADSVSSNNLCTNVFLNVIAVTVISI